MATSTFRLWNFCYTQALNLNQSVVEFANLATLTPWVPSPVTSHYPTRMVGRQMRVTDWLSLNGAQLCVRPRPSFCILCFVLCLSSPLVIVSYLLYSRREASCDDRNIRKSSARIINSHHCLSPVADRTDRWRVCFGQLLFKITLANDSYQRFVRFWVLTPIRIRFRM